MQMNPVNICPKTTEEVHKSSRMLNCSKDEYGNNQYLCLPNVEKTSLVEFCHTGTMGLQPDGMKLTLFYGGKTFCRYIFQSTYRYTDFSHR